VSYGDQTFRFRGDREERDTSSTTPVYRPPSYTEEYPAPAESTSTLGFSRRAVTPAELDDVFDDPQLGDPGMDRMGVHALWELVLLLATAGLAAWIYHTHRAALTGDGLRATLLLAATLGFLTLAAGLSLRAAVPNLAVGPVAVASAVFFATHSNHGFVRAIAITLPLAAAVGLLIGLFTVVLHVPAWASSVGGALGLIVWIQKQSMPAHLGTTYQPTKHAYYWYGAFAALVLLGGFLGLVKPIRRGLGRYRPIGDPALRRGTGAAVVACLAMIASCALAGLAGVLGLLADVRLPADGFALTGLALGVALLGGTSAFGRRGGIFGSLFAASLLALVMTYSNVANLRISDYALAAGAIAAGLVVTRLVESFGRPVSARQYVEEEEDEPWINPARLEEAANPGGYTAPRQSGWTSQLPARNNDDTWSGSVDNRWGAR
jgi:ribose/xylose/arabinose/galactoside ABC-type transport system permease subunit